MENELNEIPFLEERVEHPWRLLIAPDGPAHGQFLVFRDLARQAERAEAVHEETEQFAGLGVRDRPVGAGEADPHEKRRFAKLWEIGFGQRVSRSAGAVDYKRVQTLQRRGSGGGNRFPFELEAVVLQLSLELRP